MNKNLRALSFKAYSVLFLWILLMTTACSNSGYQVSQTDKAAAAGAVVGGGVGALAGNSAGNTAVGLGLGAVAGAGVGAFIGDKFRQNDETLSEQKAMIAKQQQQIADQQADIAGLRESGQDQISYKNNLKPANSIVENDLSANPNEITPVLATEASETYSEQLAGSTEAIESEATAAYDWENDAKRSQAIKNTNNLSTECQQAKSEATQAESTDELAEKLYHYRRALRLCPDQASFHTGISKIYLKLDRSEDARFELQEALKLDPNNSEASELLRTL